MRNFETLYEVWQYCQELISLKSEEIKKISGDEFASLFILAEKKLISEVYLISYDLGFKPVDSWFERSLELSDSEGVLLGNISIGFDSLFFSKDYKYFLSIIIHQLCRTKYANRTKTFWELFEKCLMSKGLITSDYDGWHIQPNGKLSYEVPFKNYHRSTKYNIIKEKLLKKKGGEMIMPFVLNIMICVHTNTKGLTNGVIYPCVSGEAKLWNVSQMIRDLLDLDSFVLVNERRKKPLKLHDLIYLKDEKELLFLMYDSKVKKDEDRITYIVNNMNKEDKYDFSSYTSCFINLEVDVNHPLNLVADLDCLKEMRLKKDINMIITYSFTYRCKNLNKCEMLVVLSK